MISSEHEIWKFAYVAGELDDWLSQAEVLIQKWSAQNKEEVKFQTTFEIIIASLLLVDDLLPASARRAVAKVVVEAINEADENKLRIKCLHIHPPKPGRKEDPTKTFIRLSKVMRLIKEGKTATEAYEVVAKEHFKSPDTIRREYERMVKKGQERKASGANER